jgi:hypothetical protein
MEKLTQRQDAVIEYLKDKLWYVSPTEIGNLFGGHSSIGSPICKSLVKIGRLERNKKGWYKLRCQE